MVSQIVKTPDTYRYLENLIEISNPHLEIFLTILKEMNFQAEINLRIL
jgi:hypothetical protein